jgi:hypothetical protein
MHDSIAAWMIGGGVRSEIAERDLGHRVAIHEARVACDAAKPGFLDRILGRTLASDTTPALDCCVA